MASCRCWRHQSGGKRANRLAGDEGEATEREQMTRRTENPLNTERMSFQAEIHCVVLIIGH